MTLFKAKLIFETLFGFTFVLFLSSMDEYDIQKCVMLQKDNAFSLLQTDFK